MIEINNQCVGCAACQNICRYKAIKMLRNNEGFWYPKIDKNKCVKCNQCERVCPILKENINSDFDYLIYAGYSNLVNKKMPCSSGAIYPILIRCFFDNYPNGVAFGVKIEGKKVCHFEAFNYEEMIKGFGSKYVQSDLKDSFSKIKNYLQEEKNVLFSGTPCQTAALKTFLGGHLNEHLITQTILCHGVASPKVFERYLDNVEIKYGKKIEEISFRSKEYGWEKYGMKIYFEDNGQFFCESRQDTFHKAFGGDLALRNSCYNCKFKYPNYNADIVLGDFWNVESICPEIYNDLGVSVIIIASSKGLNLFNAMQKSLTIKQIDLSDIVKSQKGVIKGTPMNSKRAEFFENLDNENLDDLVNRLTRVPLIMKIRIGAGKVYRRLLSLILRRMIK